ncbi:AEL345Wp [Eremothecium gossypii ATCC 10895]|uniref:AEL345Wp n=1 Tax=Eremothecium gossypii (strain ATCC 10895 / CBS 109.51 / FGSC 9923 / NRRL Y-1056) TaxID=284811 RepID=Q758U7_EREGS|nr:AEL345Wp [Eremothecium gossypii ATCC 10895]AAS52339.1 AEL345Wp [Eremothecium gossypii ATCC 10895]
MAFFRGRLRPILGLITLAIVVSTCFLGLSLLTEEFNQGIVSSIHQWSPPSWLVKPSNGAKSVNEAKPQSEDKPSSESKPQSEDNSSSEDKPDDAKSSLLDLLTQEGPDVVALWDLQERCKRYFELTYRKEPAWSNQVPFLSRDIISDASYSAKLMERWRIFADCFIEGNEPLSTTLDGRVDIFDFQQRMYPFLTKVRRWEEIWPMITDLNTGEQYQPGHLKDGQRLTIDDNLSFWKNWQLFSKGRGITITAGAEHVEMLPRLLNVLDHIGNTLPIELINAADLPPTTIDKIAKYVQMKSNQTVRLVDCGKTLEHSYRSLITGFRHKWLAYIFNTFEEAVFIDLDAVPFVDLEKLFEVEGYKSEGILMFRDRSYDGEKPDDCPKAMRIMMPSPKEHTMWQHGSNYDKQVAEDELTKKPRDAGAATFYIKYMEGKSFHMAESGLIVMHKNKKLPSLLISLMLHMTFETHLCSHGDKEYLWLGQLVSGENYYVDPRPPAIIGVPQLVSNHGQVDEYKICSAQIAHMDDDGSILWVNGGLKNCKFDAVERDFEDYTEYFSKKYINKENLQKFYDLEVDMQMAFIPDFVDSDWVKAPECRAFTWCSTIKADSMEGAEYQSYIIKKGDPRLREYNKIAEIWSKAPYLSSIA